MYGRFPYDTAPASPAQKPHPCLVLDVFIDDTTGEHWVVVAAGTSKGVSNLHTGEFAVSAKERKPFEKSGLAFDTKFSVQRHSVAKLPYNDDWFDVPPERRITNQKTPLIGVLDQSYLRALQAAGSNADIAQTLADLEKVPLGALPRK